MTAPDRQTFDENDLHAYVDGQLDPDRAEALETWLADNPDAAQRVSEWQAQNAAIHTAFGALPPAAEAADAALIAGLARPRRSRWVNMAAALALLLAGGALGSLATTAVSDRQTAYVQTLPEASKANYVIYASEVRHPVEVGADQETHLVTWLGKRLGRTLTAPDLSNLGYHLVGGRLVPYSGKPGAMLMYENAGGERATVMIGTNSAHRGTSFRYSQDGDIGTFYWVDGDYGYALSAPLERDALLKLATAVHKQE